MLNRIALIFVILIIARGHNSSCTDLLYMNIKSLIFVTTIKGDIHAINSETGQEIWRTSLYKPLLESYYSQAKSTEEFIEQLKEGTEEFPLLVPLSDGELINFIPNHGAYVIYHNHS